MFVPACSCLILSALAREATLLSRVSASGGGELACGVCRCVGDVVLVLRSTGVTPLMSASGKGHKEVVELLLDRKADLEAKDNEGARVTRKSHGKHRHHGRASHINGSRHTSHLTHHSPLITHRISHITRHISAQ